MAATPTIILAGTLGHINVAAAAAVAILNPLMFQLDFSLFGALGLGGLQFDLQAQLQAAIAASLNITTPLPSFLIALAGLAQIEAELRLALTIPFSLSVSVNASLIAALTARLGGIEAMIKASISLKIPAVQLLAEIEAAIGAGPAFLIAFDAHQPVTLADAGTGLSLMFNQVLTNGTYTINPTDPVYGVVILTASPVVFASLGVLLRTS